MSLALSPQLLPLALDADGVIRVGETRVTLDTIWTAFIDGASAEEIAERFPSVEIADVYQTIGYCLAHQQAIEDYLRDRQSQRDSVRAENELRTAPVGIRQRLMARQASGDAASC